MRGSGFAEISARNGDIGWRPEACTTMFISVNRLLLPQNLLPQLATNQLANNRVGWTITRDWISARCNQSVMIIALLRRMSIKVALEDLLLSKRERERERRGKLNYIFTAAMHWSLKF